MNQQEKLIIEECIQSFYQSIVSLTTLRPRAKARSKYERVKIQDEL